MLQFFQMILLLLSDIFHHLVESEAQPIQENSWNIDRLLVTLLFLVNLSKEPKIILQYTDWNILIYNDKSCEFESTITNAYGNINFYLLMLPFMSLLPLVLTKISAVLGRNVNKKLIDKKSWKKVLKVFFRKQ